VGNLFVDNHIADDDGQGAVEEEEEDFDIA
jgi:hypothetical protein